MKKMIVIMAAVAAMTLVAFSPMTTSSGSGWRTSRTDTLYNADQEMTLTLYSRGTATLTGSGFATQGTYDIDLQNNIVINWEDYAADKGFVTTQQTTSGKRVKTAVIKGYTFTNTERFVVSRPRR